MKKLLSVILAIMMLVICTFGASAAGDINANEQKILDLLSTKIDVGGSHAEIPAEYINQAKAYFMTIDIEDDEAEQKQAFFEEREIVLQALLKELKELI